MSEDLVRFDDPRWAQVGLTYRQLDYWTTNGYLSTAYETNPGSGHARRWPASEIDVAGRIVALIGLGFTARAAAGMARDHEERRRVAAALTQVGAP